MDIPLDKQRGFWNEWNSRNREASGPDLVSWRRCFEVITFVKRLELKNPQILEIGCGTGWLAEQLVPFGRVTATDLADEVIARARARNPNVSYVAGDIMTLPLSLASYDLVVTLETIFCVADQQAFVERIADLLKPGGHLILTTQNKYVFERRDDVAPVGDGQLRSWLTVGDVRRLLRKSFEVRELKTVVPAGRKGFLHLVNSVKLNSVLSRIVSVPRLEAAKEYLGFGQTIVVLARKR